MRIGARALAGVMIAVTCFGVLGLPGCGGGSEGGGGDDLPSFLSVSGTTFFGTRTGGQESLQPFPTVPATGVPVPAGGSMTVPGAEFNVGMLGRQDFIQVTFNLNLDATTIFPSGTGGGAADGIVVFRNSVIGGQPQSTPVPFRLDSAGIIDGANAFPSPGIAPPVLRLYYDTDADLTTAEFMPEGAYSLRINPTLLGFNGAQLCVNPATGCPPNPAANGYLPELSFAIGTETTPLSIRGGTAGAGGSNIAQSDPAVPLNSEIQLNFTKAVAFDTLVGGAANLTTLDPFITRPFLFVGDPTANNCAAAGPAMNVFGIDVGNLLVYYTAPIDPVSQAVDPLPQGLGIVVYMPDPFLNPTQVRIRFVDAMPTPAPNTPGTGPQLNGMDNPTGIGAALQYQNYASNPEKLPVRSNDPARNNALLRLPPRRVVPGSLQGYSPALGATDPQAACVDIVVVSDMFADPTGLACSVPPMPPGATDRLSTPNPFRFNEPGMVFDYRLQFCFAAGPALARNPHPPDALFVGTLSNNKGLAVINQAGTMSDAGAPGSDTSVPAFAGSQPIGTVVLMPNRLQNTSILGTPADIEVGHFLLTQQAQTVTANNSLANPGRRATNIRGTPDTQNGTTPDGLLGVLGIVPPPFPPLQPWGNFVYVADSDANEVKVFNGYNFQLLTSLVGVGSPRGLAISPDLEFLYVSNFNQATVTRVFVNPVGALFHTVSTVIPVGSGPTAISVQPGNEDAFVCNFGENSFSLIDTATGLELQRFADPGAVGPSDVFITFRMLGMGLTNAYMAFIVNRFSNNVTVYESDSPAVPENGLTGTVKATRGGFFGPARGTSNWQTFILVGGPGGTGSVEPGCYIANTLGDRVDELTLQNFTLSPPPGFPGPAGQRTFRIQKSYVSAGPVAGAPPSDVSIDTFSGLYNIPAIGINNAKGLNDPSAGGGVPTFVVVSYPSVGLVGVWDYRSPVLRTTASVPGCDILQSYYDQ